MLACKAEDTSFLLNCRYDMAFAHSPWVFMQLVEKLAESMDLKERHE